MKKKLYLAAFLLLWPAAVWAKRIPPPVILPVDDGAYRFVVLSDFLDRAHNPYRAGHVVAYLKATGEKIWDKYLYKVWVNPAMEQDVQDVYIKKMYLDTPNRLVLQNEKGRWFVLERRTGDPLHVDKFLKKEDDPSVYYTHDNRVEPIIAERYFITADKDPTYGHQTLQAFDLPTGKLLWKKRIPLPKAGEGGRSRISFMVLSRDGLEITFEDGSECLVDIPSGRIYIKRAEK